MNTNGSVISKNRLGDVPLKSIPETDCRNVNQVKLTNTALRRPIRTERIIHYDKQWLQKLPLIDLPVNERINPQNTTNSKCDMMSTATQIKAHDKEQCSSLNRIDMSSAQEDVKIEGSTINAQKPVFRSQASQKDWLTASPLPWFRYEMQCKGTEWIRYLDLVHRLT